MEIIIKRILPEELDERFPELNKLFDTSDFPDYAKTRKVNLASGKELCITANLSGKLAGEVNIMLENTNIPMAIIPNRRAYIFALRVQEAARGLGIAQILLSEAIEACVSRGYLEQTVGVQKDNAAALHIYEKAGFKSFIENMEEEMFGVKYTFDLLLRA